MFTAIKIVKKKYFQFYDFAMILRALGGLIHTAALKNAVSSSIPARILQTDQVETNMRSNF